MRRIVAIAVALLIAFLFLVPAALAADPDNHRGQVLVAVRGNVTLPAGEVADVVVVVDGTATINGQVRTLVVVEGSAVLTGAQVHTIWAVRSDVELGPGTVVSNDVLTVDSAVLRVGDAIVTGEVRDVEGSIIAFGAMLAPALFMFWLGFGLATLVAGLMLAGLAARQVRATEQLISREPLLTLLVGLVGMIVVPTMAILLMITIVGAPLGLAVLFGAWPLVAFLGYLVAGIWIGDWLLARLSPGSVHERPYLAAVLGLLLMQMISLVPVVNLVAAIAGLLGFGAVLLAGWRTLTTRPGTPAATAFPVPAPLAG